MTRTVLCGLAVALVSALSGCASIVSGTNQPLTVETRANGSLVSGATCKLVNDKGTWYVTTPGSVTIHRSMSDLKLSCDKEGTPPGQTTVKSSTKPMTFGNAIFGGVVGVGVDVVSGAAFDYPDLIHVEMNGITDGFLPSASVGASPGTSSPAPANRTLQASTLPPDAPNGSQKPTPAEPSDYPRTLSGQEIANHFQRHPQLEMETAKVAFLLKIHPGGKVERDCVTCKTRHADGTLEIKSDQSIACFNWYWVTYPASGCYSVVQTGNNAFSLEDTTAKQQYAYLVPQSGAALPALGTPDPQAVRE